MSATANGWDLWGIWTLIRVQAGFWRSLCRARAVSVDFWDGKKNL